MNGNDHSDALGYEYEKYQRHITSIDIKYLDSHNSRYKSEHPYHLHRGMEPCPFEGDLRKAKVIFLLANPHFQDAVSQPIDHQRIDGWGLWGLSSATSHSMHGWWRPRLQSVMCANATEEQWRQLSYNVASFQAVPWASRNFHECKLLPSKRLLTETLRRLAVERPEILFVVMRQRAYWDDVLRNLNVQIINTKNPRCSYISPGNFNHMSDWRLIVDKISTPRWTEI